MFAARTGAILALAALSFACKKFDPTRGRTKSLADARSQYAGRVASGYKSGEPLPEPPADVFRVVRYRSPAGELAAYLSVDPKDGKKHPAIVWITGGDCNSLGDVWSLQPRENEQSARAYREAGLIMMFPALRGGNQNPGEQESFYGEVDDVIAAATYLSQQPFVDPARIYLGGHSSGGTLVLLVAEMTSSFRAIFSFGPVGDIALYDDGSFPGLRKADRLGLQLRSPGLWLHAITSPTFVIEGTRGAIEPLRSMAAEPENPRVRFYEVEGADHFNVLGPVNALIAQKIVADVGAETNLTITAAELAGLFRR